MRTIWKFPLNVTDGQVLTLPRGARILDVQMQGPSPTLWAVVDPEAEKVNRVVWTCGTGNPMPEQMWHYDYVGSVQDRVFVWHVFIEPERAA